LAKILFVPSVGRGIIQFRLILDELNRNGHHPVTTIALDRGRAAALEKEGFPSRDISDYGTKNMLQVIRAEKPDILVTDFGTAPTINLINAASYAGIPSLMIDCGIKADSAPIVRAHQKHFLGKFGAWLKSTRKFQSLPYSLATLPAIKGLWKSLPGLAGTVFGFLQGMPAYVNGMSMAVLSPAAKDWFIRDGFPPESVFVIGQPRFDLVFKQQFDPARLRQELVIPGDKGIVVLATQPMVEAFLWTEKERQQFVGAVVRAMTDFPDKQLVIKLHPDEDPAVYRQLLKDIGDDTAAICRDTNTYELLNACDLLITFYSTVALEAMLFNKPVITLNLSGKPDIFPYALSGAAIGVYREEGLVPAVRQALYDAAAREELARKSREFVAEQVYRPDGRASQRGAELVLQLIKEAGGRRKIV
jgi:hypothetical protein